MSVSNGCHSLSTDYPLQPGEQSAGFKPLELLLVSLAACCGSVVALLLQRMHQPVRSLEVEVRAQRRDEHPTVFTRIDLEIVIRGNTVNSAAVEQPLSQAEERLCPVWAMLKTSTPIAKSYRIVAE